MKLDETSKVPKEKTILTSKMKVEENSATASLIKGGKRLPMANRCLFVPQAEWRNTIKVLNISRNFLIQFKNPAYGSSDRVFFFFFASSREKTQWCVILFVHVRGTTQSNALCTLTVETLNSLVN